VFGLLAMIVLGAAQAADVEHQLRWSIAIEGQPVGERTLTVRYLPDGDGTRRVLESLTHVEASVAGFNYRFDQRLTAHASSGSASFSSVLKENDVAREVQGRPTPFGWSVSLSERGRTRSWELEGPDVDLSTADLIDPGTRRSLGALDTVHLLSAETGEVLTGKVEHLGTKAITLRGVDVPVDGLAIVSDQGRQELWYSTDGALVRYQLSAMGKALIATLVDQPPAGVDDTPVTVGAAGITETDL